MARIESLNILKSTTGKDYLAETYGAVIENVQKTMVSEQIKNRDLSGTPQSGTVEAKRFVNTSSSAYGTARSGGAGTAIAANQVTIAINTNRELINEVEEKDTVLYGVDNLIQRKAQQNANSMKRELERAFFTEAKTSGTSVILTGATIQAQVEELIQQLETLQNDYIDGVDRDMIHLILSPSIYGQLRTYLDAGVANIQTDIEGFGSYHGVKVYSSTYLPTDVTMIAMIDGAIAQPVLTSMDEPGKIQLSDAYHFGYFFYYGTKAVMPDAIFYVEATTTNANTDNTTDTTGDNTGETTETTDTTGTTDTTDTTDENGGGDTTNNGGGE